MSFPTQPQDNLSHTVDRLNRVVRATKELNSTLDLSELARIILRIVREEVGIERGTVWVMSPGRIHLKSLAAQEVDQEIRLAVGSGIAGTVARDGEIIDIPDAYQDARFDQSFDAKLGFRTNDIYCMPVRNPEGVIVGVLQLLNRSRALTEDDEEFLADISVHIGLAVENATRHLEILEKERIEQQLELARQIIMVKSVRKWRLLAGVLRSRCPICLDGRVFSGLVGTRDHCDGCGYIFSHANRYFVGSAVFTWAVTLAIAFGLFSILNSAVMLPTDPFILSILFFPAIAFVVWFFRIWRMFWLALDLHGKPPRDENFRPEGKLPSETAGATPQAPAPQG